MSGIVETIQAIVRQELAGLRLTELGLVTAVRPHAGEGDSDNYSCDVELKNSGLALKRVPVATERIGTVAIPNLDDLVLVTFYHGDVNQPVIVGRLYNDEDRPPLNNPDEVIFRLPLAQPDDKTLTAAIRNLQDRSPPREIRVEMPPKITVRISDGTVRATAGKSEMVIDQSNASGGTVTVVTGRTRIVMDQDGDVTVEAAGAMTLKATRDLRLEGLNVAIKGQLNAEVEGGQQATLKGGLTAEVRGSASTTVQGGLVSIKGVTSFSP
jgi:phage baseplate assembly protein gpV